MGFSQDFKREAQIEKVVVGVSGGGASPRCMQVARNSLKFFPKKLKVVRSASDFGFRGFAYGFLSHLEALGSNREIRFGSVGGRSGGGSRHPDNDFFDLILALPNL